LAFRVSHHKPEAWSPPAKEEDEVEPATPRKKRR